MEVVMRRERVRHPVALLLAVKGQVESALASCFPSTVVSREEELELAAAYDEELGHNLSRRERSKRARDLGDGGPAMTYRVPVARHQ